jgi:SPP1 family predicted phage head-tail adaptor
VRLGKLLHRISVEQVAESQDTDGSVIETLSVFVVAQASIELLSGREYIAAQSTQAEVAHRIRLRCLSGITPKMRVNYNPRIFDFLSVININDHNRELQLQYRCALNSFQKP